MTSKEEKLTKAQREGLEWCWKDCHRRWSADAIIGDPAASTMTSLVKRGLLEKHGSAGWPISYALTDAGRTALERSGG